MAVSGAKPTAPFLDYCSRGLRAITVAVAIMAVAAANARADASRRDMCACTKPMPINSGPRSDGPNMRAALHAAITDARARPNNRARPASGSDPVAIRVGSGTNAADMRSGSEAVFAGVRIHPHTEDLDACARGIPSDGGEDH
jgi:hypothetical protein